MYLKQFKIFMIQQVYLTVYNI